MPSRKHTRVIIGGVAAIAIARGSYGIVSATSGSGPSSSDVALPCGP
jgi:hypothetical protein